MGHAKTRRVQFRCKDIRRVLVDVPNHYPIQVEELLITALARTVAIRSSSSDVVQLERHGRINLAPIRFCHGPWVGLPSTVFFIKPNESINQVTRSVVLSASRQRAPEPASLLQLKSDSFAISPICYPGRESRFLESLPNSIIELANQIGKELVPSIDHGYVLLGYSMGAIVGYELVRCWRNCGLPQPSAFIALAARAPHRPFEKCIHLMDDEQFRQTLIEMGGTTPQLLDDAEAMAIFEPVLRRDFQHCDEYVHQPMPPMECPIQAIASDSHPLLSLEDAESWRARTEADFHLQIMQAHPHILPRDELLVVIQEAYDFRLAPLRVGVAAPCQQ